MTEQQYKRRRRDDGLWDIVYVTSGEVVIVSGGYPLAELDDREVNEAWELLLAGELTD